MAEETSNESIEDDKMSMKERENWLRERGVQIETPSDRKEASPSQPGYQSVVEQLQSFSLSKNKDEDSKAAVVDNDGIPFVYIPHDDSRPIETLQLPSSLAQQPGDALPNYVKSYFADNKAIDTSLLQEQATKQFAGGDLNALASTNISASAMANATSQGSVETFPLVHPADTNQFQGVYVYLDEVGLLKKLPTNKRASQLAGQCGYSPPPLFYGDVFLGRVKSKPVMQNIPFEGGKDTAGDATWMQRAVSENVAWQQALNDATGKSGQTQPAHAGTDGTVANEGNFTWTQDDDELELVVPLVLSSKDDTNNNDNAVNKKLVKVKFASRTVSVTYSGEERLTLKLYGPIDVDGSTWTIDGKNLAITCEKSNAGDLWPRVSQ